MFVNEQLVSKGNLDRRTFLTDDYPAQMGWRSVSQESDCRVEAPQGSLGETCRQNLILKRVDVDGVMGHIGNLCLSRIRQGDRDLTGTSKRCGKKAEYWDSG